MHAGLLRQAQDGWDQQPTTSLVGSPNWMAWRAGAALKQAQLGRPIGVTPPKPLGHLPGHAPKGLYLDVRYRLGECLNAVFVTQNGQWAFERLQVNNDLISIPTGIIFWLQRRGWAWG